MSRTYRHRHHTRNRPLRTLAPVKRLRAGELHMGVLLPRCFEAARPKVCYYREEDARAAAALAGKPLRVYACGSHYHLTSKV